MRDLAGGEGFEPVEVRRDEARLQKGAYQVLTLREVQADLTPDGAIHHRQERGRQLDEVHAPHVAARHEPPQISHYPAPEREERPTTGQAGPGEPADHPF